MAAHKGQFEVCLDKKRLLQVLTNFTTNAIKYTEKGVVEFGYKYIDEGVRIFVNDSGIGIAEEDHSRVFACFQKLSDFAPGTGLGVSICKAIADSFDGKIGIESAEGVGSRFWLWLPDIKEVVEFTL